MRKFADSYLNTEEWGIRECGFHSDRSRVSESLFNLANEYMGVRGTFEEGYSGDTLYGTYISGVFEESVSAATYKGVPNRSCFVVNAVDFFNFRIRIAGEDLDLACASFDSFERALDFRNGLLTRSFVWHLKSSGTIELRFERLLSMEYPEAAFQRISIGSLDVKGRIEMRTGLDFSIDHESYKKNFWEPECACETQKGGAMAAKTVGTGQYLCAAFDIHCDKQYLSSRGYTNGKYSGREIDVTIEPGETVTLEKRSLVLKHPPEPGESMMSEACHRLEHHVLQDFAGALESNKRYWGDVWSRSDIAIEGDPENQQGIRFGIFQLEQTYHGGASGHNIGAKGLTGEFYDGKYFWDTEVFCLPYYLFQRPSTARALLEFRYRTLPQAIERARELDHRGACFPISTLDGSESCTLWQHANLQLQPSTGVAYALWHYWHCTGDDGFMLDCGVEMLIQIARFLASRAQWSEQKQAWGYYGVMGPDEFHLMVNNNAYTNYMGARALNFANEIVKDFSSRYPDIVSRIAGLIELAADEPAHWQEIANGMYLPQKQGSSLFEQHDGYFDLPHVDIKAIPAEDFPLYHTWSYDRIYRNDMIKQPDVLMFLFLYNRSFTLETKRVNYDYYEPRCIHESSLSPSIHSILAAELGKRQEALSFFEFATRIDLDNYNRNTHEGLHMTAIAAAWMNVVYGLAGFRSDGTFPSFAPMLPPGWKRYSFKLTYRHSVIYVSVTREGSEFRLIEGQAVEIAVAEKTFRLTPGKPEKSQLFMPHEQPVVAHHIR